METISIDHERKGMLLMLGLGTIMVGASLWLLYAGLFTNFTLPQMGPATGPFSVLVGGIGTLFFGYAFFFILYRFLFPKGALIINEEGIIDRTTAIGSKDIIRFEKMEEAKLEIHNSTPYIGINVTNEAEYLESLPWIKRKAQSINKEKFGMSMVTINAPVESRERLHELIDIINERIEITQKRTNSNTI